MPEPGPMSTMNSNLPLLDLSQETGTSHWHHPQPVHLTRRHQPHYRALQLVRAIELQALVVPQEETGGLVANNATNVESLAILSVTVHVLLGRPLVRQGKLHPL